MNKFESIKKEYADFDKQVRKDFRWVVRDTERGIWGPSDVEVVYNFFKKVNLRKFNSFIDLGCGDGRVVLVASLFTKAKGIEVDEDLVRKGKEISKKLDVEAELVCDDFYKEDLSKYDVVFVNPDQGFQRGLEGKLLKEFKGRLFVYNNLFSADMIKKHKIHWFDSLPIVEHKVNL